MTDPTVGGFPPPPKYLHRDGPPPTYTQARQVSGMQVPSAPPPDYDTTEGFQKMSQIGHEAAAARRSRRAIPPPPTQRRGPPIPPRPNFTLGQKSTTQIRTPPPIPERPKKHFNGAEKAVATLETIVKPSAPEAMNYAIPSNRVSAAANEGVKTLSKQELVAENRKYNASVATDILRWIARIIAIAGGLSLFVACCTNPLTFVTIGLSLIAVSFTMVIAIHLIEKAYKLEGTAGPEAGTVLLSAATGFLAPIVVIAYAAVFIFTGGMFALPNLDGFTLPLSAVSRATIPTRTPPKVTDEPKVNEEAKVNEEQRKKDIADLEKSIKDIDSLIATRSKNDDDKAFVESLQLQRERFAKLLQGYRK